MYDNLVNPQPIQEPIKEVEINTPLEYIANQIPRKALSFLILAFAGVIGIIGVSGINYFIIGNTTFISTLIAIIEIIISLIFLLQAGLIYKSVIKRGDNILIREHRGGIMSFDKIPRRKEIRFDPKDPTTAPTILWNGTATEKQSGAKVILLKEGSKSNENINLCVSETDWTKNLAAMVRAKTFADIAESDLLNTPSIFGLKWQDMALIIMGLLLLAIVVIQIGVVPSMVSDEVIKNLLGGPIQNALKSVVVGA